MITSGTESARKLTHARILLKADTGESPLIPINRSKKLLKSQYLRLKELVETFALEGLEAALTAKKRSEPSKPRKFDGEKEAHLIALACSAPPEGYASWSLRLLADRMVELNHFSSISHESIRKVLKKRT